MQLIVKTVVSLILTVCMQAGIANMVSTTPDEAVNDFLSGLQQGESRTMERYMDNQYVNFICNIEGDEAVTDRMREALFENFSYEVEKIGEKNDVAVAKVTVKSSDFSGVMAAYDKASYDYVTDNLGSDEVGNKESLNARCLEIYVEQVEAAASAGASLETVVYIPMIDNGNYGWNILVSDDLMKTILGNLEMPAVE